MPGTEGGFQSPLVHPVGSAGSLQQKAHLFRGGPGASPLTVGLFIVQLFCRCCRHYKLISACEVYAALPGQRRWAHVCVCPRRQG